MSYVVFFLMLKQSKSRWKCSLVCSMESSEMTSHCSGAYAVSTGCIKIGFMVFKSWSKGSW